MDRAEMDRLIEEHLRAEDSGDLDAAIAVYTDDVEHDVVGAPGGPLYGRAAARPATRTCWRPCAATRWSCAANFRTRSTSG